MEMEMEIKKMEMVKRSPCADEDKGKGRAFMRNVVIELSGVIRRCLGLLWVMVLF
jgi:hypothetical protein